jgi:glycosyltransferase involved in cell wall biosynthesis
MTYVPGLVTVMIPSYNYRQFLRECVESAATQEGVAVDVAIVDNASTDGSLDLGRELAEQYANVRLVVHPDNGGIITSFNRCRDEVRGEFAVLLCADDMLTPGSLARSVALMQQRPDVAMVYGPAVDFLHLADVTDEQLRGTDAAPLVYTGDDWISRRCRWATNPIRTPETLMRSTTLDVAGRLDPTLPFTSDLNMWLRMAVHGAIAYLPGHPQALYRKHANNFGAAFLNHDSAYSDIEARWFAFTKFFDTLGDDPRRPAWEATVRRTLAAEARYVATRAYVRLDDADRDRVVGKLDDLAELLQPGGASRGEAIGWTVRRALGPRWARRFPPLLVRGVWRRGRRSLIERRRLARGV